MNEDTERFLDQMQKRMQQQTRARAMLTTQEVFGHRIRCPSPGCPHPLLVDTEVDLLRCEMHGPMAEITWRDSAPAAATS